MREMLRDARGNTFQTWAFLGVLFGGVAMLTAPLFANAFDENIKERSSGEVQPRQIESSIPAGGESSAIHTAGSGITLGSALELELGSASSASNGDYLEAPDYEGPGVPWGNILKGAAILGIGVAILVTAPFSLSGLALVGLAVAASVAVATTLELGECVFGDEACTEAFDPALGVYDSVTGFVQLGYNYATDRQFRDALHTQVREDPWGVASGIAQPFIDCVMQGDSRSCTSGVTDLAMLRVPVTIGRSVTASGFRAAGRGGRLVDGIENGFIRTAWRARHGGGINAAGTAALADNALRRVADNATGVHNGSFAQGGTLDAATVDAFFEGPVADVIAAGDPNASMMFTTLPGQHTPAELFARAHDAGFENAAVYIGNDGALQVTGARVQPGTYAGDPNFSTIVVDSNINPLVPFDPELLRGLPEGTYVNYRVRGIHGLSQVETGMNNFVIDGNATFLDANRQPINFEAGADGYWSVNGRLEVRGNTVLESNGVFIDQALARGADTPADIAARTEALTCNTSFGTCAPSALRNARDANIAGYPAEIVEILSTNPARPRAHAVAAVTLPDGSVQYLSWGNAYDSLDEVAAVLGWGDEFVVQLQNDVLGYGFADRGPFGANQLPDVARISRLQTALSYGGLQKLSSTISTIYHQQANLAPGQTHTLIAGGYEIEFNAYEIVDTRLHTPPPAPPAPPPPLRPRAEKYAHTARHHTAAPP